MGRIQFPSASLSVLAWVVMLVTAFAIGTSWAATTVDLGSTAAPTKRDTIETAQSLRQQGDAAGPSCESTKDPKDGGQACSCKDGQKCFAYATTCNCIGTPTGGSSSDTNSTGMKRTK